MRCDLLIFRGIQNGYHQDYHQDYYTLKPFNICNRTLFFVMLFVSIMTFIKIQCNANNQTINRINYLYSKKIYVQLQTFRQLIQINQNKQNISTVVVLNSKLQIFLKTSLLSNTFVLTKNSMDAISSIKPFLLGSVWFNTIASTNSFICITCHMLHNQGVGIDNLQKSNVFIHTFYVNERDNYLPPINEFSF